MARVTQNYAPYAPPKNVLEFVHRRRERGLPDVIGVTELQQIGIPEGNVSRTLRALQFLGLIEDDGRQTHLLERLGSATQSEYQEAMAEMVRSAYQSVLTIVDPGVDTETAVADAFRRYHPAAQRSRMVALFLALCREAAITKDRSRRSVHVQSNGSNPKYLARTPVVRAPRVPNELTGPLPNGSANGSGPSLDYRLVSALVQQLPSDARWTKKKRERWLHAVAAAVDLMVEVTDE